MDYLKFTATMLCLITGALASFLMLKFDLDGVENILAGFVSLSCLPLGLYMAYDTVTSSKF
jgi:hypothetical protein